MSAKNGSYYISPTALRIEANAVGGDHRYVAVSVVSGALMMMSVNYYHEYIPDITYTAGQQNPTWILSGYSTRLQDSYDDKVVHVYVRLSLSVRSGLIVFSDNDYVKDSKSKYAEKVDDYVYVKIGSLSAPVSGKRTLDLDTGCLLTQYGKDTADSLGEFFSLVEGLIQPQKNFRELTVEGLLSALNGLTLSGSLNINESELTAIRGYADYENIGKTLIGEDTTVPSCKLVFSYIANLLEDIDSKYLRKDKDDTAKGKITFEVVQLFDEGLEVGEYKEGDFGSGAAMKTDEAGNTFLEVDYAKFRKKATFNDLEIKSLKHVGGTVLLSPASATLSGVVEHSDNVFVCYFRKTDGDGKAVKNEWRVGDQARCQTFDVEADKQRYYWRLVVGVDYIANTDYPSDDYHCILLSVTDCDNLSDDPMAGDEVVQLGNRTEEARQSAILMSAYDINSDTAPCIIQYDGIDSYDLTGKEVQRWSPGNNTFSGRVKITGGSGWEKLDGLQGTLDEIEEKAQSALAESALASTATSNLSVRLDGVESGVSQSIAEINNRLDGVVENYFLEGEPTLENEPAVSWTTDTEKINHVGDTYTDISEYISDEETPTAGKSWRWCWCDSYDTENKDKVTDNQGNTKYLHWHPIADSDAVKALLQASKAQSTADGKSTTYLVQPSKYSEGDLWVLQEDTTVNGKPYKKGEILTTSTTNDSFVEAHWSKQVIYTDDTTALEALAKAEANEKLVQAATDAAESAQATADSASIKAESAQATANSAKETLEGWSADNVISPLEKQAVELELKKAENEYAELNGVIETYPNIDKNVYDTFIARSESYRAELGKLIANKTENTIIPSSFTGLQNSYYEYYTRLTQEVAKEAKALADIAQATAENAQEAAEEAGQRAENAAEVANNALTQINEWSADDMLTPFEKQSLLDELNRVESDWTYITANYEIFKSYIDTEEPTLYNEFNDAYSAYHKDLEDVTSEMETTTDVPADFDAHAKTFYTTRSDILTAIAEASKQYAEAVSDEQVSSLTYSASNLLRNTGFVGDDKSVRLTGESMMNVDEEMLSPSLDYWTIAGALTYSDVTVMGSMSGYDLALGEGVAMQTVETGIFSSEKYVLSVRGRGTIAFSVGGYTSESIALSENRRTIVRFRTESADNNFTLLGQSADCRICELMLEHGDIASNTWNRSILDAPPEISRLQNVQYIMNALRSKAGTEILGGLVLSSMIMLSKETDSETFSDEDISCGMNGIWANNSSVAFWAGGTFEQANESVRLVYSNPTYEPTEEELGNMASYVVTHDGTVIMNRAIVRGTVFADNGQFKGKVFATDGEFKGKVEATSGQFGDMVLGKINENNYDISASDESDGWIKFYSYISTNEDEGRWTWIAGNQQTLKQANMFLNNSVGGYCLYATCKGSVGIKVVASQAIESDGAVIFRQQHTDKDSSGATTLQMNNSFYQGKWEGLDVEKNEQGMRSVTSYPSTGLETETSVRQFAGGVEMTYKDSLDKRGAVLITGSGAYLMFGKYGIKVDDEGVKKTSDGGESWGKL